MPLQGLRFTFETLLHLVYMRRQRGSFPLITATFGLLFLDKSY